MSDRLNVRARVRCTFELDLWFCGEGLTAEALREQIGAHVALMDSIDFIGDPDVKEQIELVAIEAATPPRGTAVKVWRAEVANG